MALTVTATQGGSTANGFALRVFVLTGAAAVAAQSGASTNNQFTNVTTFTQSITTTAGSNVYGASARTPASTAATGSNATIVDDVNDTTNNEQYTIFKALNVTGGATTRGYTAGGTASGPFAQLEILAAGTLAENASSPAGVNTSGAGPLTTASFTPPGGSLLVACIGSDGGSGVTTFSMSNSGPALNWTEKVKNNPTAGDYAGVWIADIPPAGGGLPSAQPGQTWLRAFHHRQSPPVPSPPPVAAAGPGGTIQPLPTFPPPRRRLARGVWASGMGTTGIRGSVQPPPTLTPPRRRLSRAWPVWWSGKGGISPSGTVQPRPTIPVPRRRLSRAVVQFTPVTTTNQAAAAAPAGTIQPPSTLTPPRRRQVRAFIQFTPVRTVNAPPAPVPVVLNPLPNGGSTEGALWEMARTGQWPKRPPGFGPVGQVPSSGAVPPKPGERGWAGKKKRRFFWPQQGE